MKKIIAYLIPLCFLAAVCFLPGSAGFSQDGGAEFTYKLRTLRAEYFATSDENQKVLTAKEAVSILKPAYKSGKIPFVLSWINCAIARDLILWDVLQKETPEIAQAVRENVLSSAKGIVRRLRQPVSDDDMSYERYVCAVTTLIRDPISKGMFDWEELEISERDLNLLLIKKRQPAVSVKPLTVLFYQKQYKKYQCGQLDNQTNRKRNL